MVILEPTAEEVHFARNLVKKKFTDKRGEFDGSFFEKLFGTISEILINKYFQQSINQEKGFDGGHDIIINNKKYDIKCFKTIIKAKNKFEFLVPIFQNYSPDGYIFVLYNPNEGNHGKYRVAGWIDTETFKQKSAIKKAGDFMLSGNKFKTNNLVIDGKHLKSIKLLKPKHL